MSGVGQVSRTQELVYEMKVESVMSAPAITVTSDMRMIDLRALLKDNRISGVPVVEESALVGIVSVEDFINWLAQGAPDCAVRDRMSPKVLTAFAEEPLVHVVSSGKLVGVITKGDIIAGLLRELDIGYRAEEIKHYRASHLFEDIAADSIDLTFRYRIEGGDIMRGGEASSKLKKSLRRLGISPESVRRAAIAAYEAEMNVLIYARDGEMRVSVDPLRIRIEVTDAGPGIPDVDKAMEPGYSTAPDWVRELGFGAGMGLQNISRCADQFEITSIVGAGTILRITIPTVRE
jgi:anti-sigma regulatory factor (Ser/Thr protein kinase)